MPLFGRSSSKANKNQNVKFADGTKGVSQTVQNRAHGPPPSAFKFQTGHSGPSVSGGSGQSHRRSSSASGNERRSSHSHASAHAPSRAASTTSHTSRSLHSHEASGSRHSSPSRPSRRESEGHFPTAQTNAGSVFQSPSRRSSHSHRSEMVATGRSEMGVECTGMSGGVMMGAGTMPGSMLPASMRRPSVGCGSFGRMGAVGMPAGGGFPRGYGRGLHGGSRMGSYSSVTGGSRFGDPVVGGGDMVIEDRANNRAIVVLYQIRERRG